MAKPKLTPEARRILEKALRAIRRRPDTFDMDNWMVHDPDQPSTKKTPEPYCGTVACLAGHIALAAGARPTTGSGFASATFKNRRVDIPALAMKILAGKGAAAAEKRNEVWEKLFFLRGWPLLFVRQYHHGNRPDAVVGRVRHWLKTGE